MAGPGAPFVTPGLFRDAGARNAGLPAVWLHRGRPWPLTAFQPGQVAGSFPDAVRIVLAATA